MMIALWTALLALAWENAPSLGRKLLLHIVASPLLHVYFGTQPIGTRSRDHVDASRGVAYVKCASVSLWVSLVVRLV